MKAFALICFVLIRSHTFPQTSLILKKNRKSINAFWEGTTIAFQTANNQWHKGEIKRITTDSFFIQPVIVQYHLFGNDTLRFKTEGFALTDVTALPKKGFYVDYHQR